MEKVDDIQKHLIAIIERVQDQKLLGGLGATTSHVRSEATTQLLAYIDNLRADELELIFHQPKWRKKTVGEVNKYEILEYISRRIDELRKPPKQNLNVKVNKNGTISQDKPGKPFRIVK